MTYHQLIQKATKKAQSQGLESSAVKIIILELSKMNGAEFLVNINTEIPNDIYITIDNALNEYLEKHYPPQYILGYSYFYGYKMIVNKDVLIPRKETEELVSYVLATYDSVFDTKMVDVVDVGTGSGNIAIALAKEEPNMNVWATDISNEALLVAKQNAINNEAIVSFIQGNMMEPVIHLKKEFNIIVSNPPYIPNDEYVEDIVKNNEPHIALYGGIDGMKFYEEILSAAVNIITTPGIIAFEHSYSKGQAMLDLSKKYFPHAKIELIKDMQGKDRFTIITLQ